MKYSEFLQLSEALKPKGTTVSEELRLNEADPTMGTGITKTQPAAPASTSSAADPKKVSTEAGGIFTRWGRLKAKLNKTAKKAQDEAVEKVIKKYLPVVLKAEQQVVQEIVAAKKEAPNTQPKELAAMVNQRLANSRGQRKQQLQVIDGALVQLLQNYEAAMNKKIDASKSNDANKLNLKNYWLLLMSQVKLNTLGQLSKSLSDGAIKAFGTDQSSSEIYKMVQSALAELKAKEAAEAKVKNEKEAIARKADDEYKKLQNLPANRPAAVSPAVKPAVAKAPATAPAPTVKPAAPAAAKPAAKP